MAKSPPLKKNIVYLLSKPEDKKTPDLVRPGYWDWIEFDTAPFLLQNKTKIKEDGKIFYKYIWGEWLFAGYIESIEHLVEEEKAEDYEELWKISSHIWLETVQLIIFNKLMNKIGDEQ